MFSRSANSPGAPLSRRSTRLPLNTPFSLTAATAAERCCLKAPNRAEWSADQARAVIARKLGRNIARLATRRGVQQMTNGVNQAPLLPTEVFATFVGLIDQSALQRIF